MLAASTAEASEQIKQLIQPSYLQDEANTEELVFTRTVKDAKHSGKHLIILGF